jgi:AbrB family looped-hinge helix DNA binding protein
MAGEVTTKGQVTIPHEIRERLGMHPGSTVEFELVDCGVLVRRSKWSGEELVARLRGRATTGMTTDEIMELTRR